QRAHPVGNPAATVRRREQRRVAERRPDETSGVVPEARDRIPCRRRPRRDTDAEPPVPRKVFQLDGPEEDRRAEAGLRVPADVLHALRVVAVDRLALDPVADGDALAAAREEGDQAALEVDSLLRAREADPLQACERLLDRATPARVGHATRVDEVSLAPARLPPRRPHPAVELRRLLRREVTELDLFESRVPLAGGRPRARAAEELREPARGAGAAESSGPT